MTTSNSVSTKYTCNNIHSTAIVLYKLSDASPSPTVDTIVCYALHVSICSMTQLYAYLHARVYASAYVCTRLYMYLCTSCAF